MKVLAIGCDIIEIERIKKAGERNPLFLDRILTETEKEYCFNEGSRYASVAARFAAKEAMAKALGTGFSACSFLDIEIINDDKGRPELFLKGPALELFRQMGGREILLTLSHSKDYALANLIIQG